MGIQPAKAGIIGCGMISERYLQNAQHFESFDIVACADLDVGRARARAEQFQVPRACSVDELLADPDIEIVVNLTIPKAHGEICLAALSAGKHVHVEKPLAVTRAEGQEILSLAHARSLRVGCAPDTFLGGGLQTCRKLIDDGWIGEPVAATAFMLGHGHEHWHVDPDFYYQPGAGPMFDMGPYYLTALISLIGPVRRVTGSARVTFPERTITSKPKYGQTIRVNTPTHIAGVLDFENGAIGTLVTSFDVWAAQVPRIEIYGTLGSLSVPDPNTFGGPVHVRMHDSKEWSPVPLSHGYTDNSRGIAVADMANAIRSGRPHRANGDMGYHVLDIMQGILDASERGTHYELASGCERPTPLPLGLRAWTLDA